MFIDEFDKVVMFVVKKVHCWIPMCTHCHMYMWAREVHCWTAMYMQEGSLLNSHVHMGIFFFSSLLNCSGTTRSILCIVAWGEKSSHFQNICLVNVFKHYVQLGVLCYSPRTKTNACYLASFVPKLASDVPYLWLSWPGIFEATVFMKLKLQITKLKTFGL